MSNEELVEQIRQGINPVENMGKPYEQNKGFIAKIVKRYISYGEFEDLMQEAYFGLYEAVNHYESDKEVQFMSYAAYWIRQAIQRYAERTSNTIRISFRTHNLYYQYKKIVNAYMREYNEQPSDYRVGRILGVSEYTIKSMKKAMYEVSNMDSLDAELNTEDDSYSLSDTVVGSYGFEDDVVDQIIEEDKKGSLWGIVAENTDDVENKVVVCRYKANMTLDATAEIVGGSRERVRQLQAKALRKLRKPSVTRVLSERYEIALSGAYYGSVGSFKNTWTSSTERAALKLYRVE